MTKEINETIAKIKALDLSTYPIDQINALFKAFGKNITIDYRLHPGKKVIRARPHDNQWPYLTRSSHSFKPQEFNKTYQRASTPNRTMFYGSIIPEDLDEGDLDNERVVVTTEASPWIRTKETCGVRQIAYSRWEVIEDVRLVAVLHHKAFYDASSHTRKIINDFERSLDAYPEIKEVSLMISEYIASEFAKEEIPSDHHYLISALYAEMITTFGFDGILYPSVRMGGRGFNIAITPEAAKNKIKLVAAGECTIYKKAYGDSVIDNNTIAKIQNENDPFTFLPVEAPYAANEQQCLAQLGLKNIEELCTKTGNL
jgi:hypothetical protein